MASKRKSPVEEHPEMVTGTPSTVAQLVTGGKKKKSMAWDHFELIEGSQPKRAACKYCKTEYACEGRSNGTSNMLYHIKVQYSKYPYRLVDNSQQTLTTKLTKLGNEVVAVSFSLDACRKALTRMIIVDELPFRFVEGEGFRSFVHILQPKFTNMPMRTQIQRDCIRLYVEEKQKLKDLMKGHRISLTTDTWTSIQNLNYMCLTAHFVDSEWVLQKRILNFCLVPNHKGETIGKIIEKCLMDWGIECIFSVTVDNASSNNVAIKYLRRNTKNWEGTILSHKHLHMRCCAHVLNLIVSEGLRELHESIVKVRNAVRDVRSSPSRLASFRTCMEYVKLKSKKLLCLDVPTRWNSTFMMLEAAEKFHLAFDRMEGDESYFGYFDNHSKNDKILGPPSSEDWDKARVFVKFLRAFFHATLRVSGSLYATSNVFFSELFLIESKLAIYEKNQDNLLSKMAKGMQCKFDRYWSLDKINVLLYVAVVLDPRRKMHYVSFCFNDLYGEKNKEKDDNLLRKVDENLNELYDFYSLHYDIANMVVCIQYAASEEMEIPDDDSEGEVGDGDKDVASLVSRFRKHMEKKDDLENKSEVERYLLETRVKDEENFNVLQWWKSNSTKYRILSSIARDVLAVPASSVASESAFSTGGRIIDPFRSSLAPNTVEALVCAQDWLRSPSNRINLRESMDEVEAFEKVDAVPLAET